MNEKAPLDDVHDIVNLDDIVNNEPLDDVEDAQSSEKGGSTIPSFSVEKHDKTNCFDCKDEAEAVRAREIRERTRRHYRINPEEDSNEQPG